MLCELVSTIGVSMRPHSRIGVHADDLADAVGGEGAGDDTLVPDVVAVRKDRRDARAGRPAAARQLGPAPRHGAVADRTPGTSVMRSGAGWQRADDDAQVSRASPGGARRRCPTRATRLLEHPGAWDLR